MRSARYWSTWLLLILVLAAGLRLVRLTEPNELVFDETHYVPSARVMAGLVERDTLFDPKPWGRQELIARTPDPNFSHPPIGKLALATGILLFGDGPLGWRLPPLLFGMLSLVIFAWTAWRLTDSPPVALTATALLGMDAAHIVLSRTGMLDMFLFTFGVAALAVTVEIINGSKRRGLPVLAGVLIGLAIGSKESAVNVAFAAGMTVLLFGPGTWVARARQVGIMAAMTCVGYSLTSVYYMAHGYSLVEWLRFRVEVTTSLVQPLAEHRYTSRVWSWPFNYKPVWFYWNSVNSADAAEVLRGIVFLGNPVVWVGFIPASYVLFANWWESRRDAAARHTEPDRMARAGAVALVWYAGLYLPLFVLLWKRDGFLYHHFMAAAPMALGLAAAAHIVGTRLVDHVCGTCWTRWITLALAAGGLAVYYPVLVGLAFGQDYMIFLRSIIAM